MLKWKKKFYTIPYNPATHGGGGGGGGGPGGTGGLQFWYNGLPDPGIKHISTPTGGVQYLYNGLPANSVF